MQEKIVETKNCKQCSSKFEITDKDLEFYEKVSPIFAGKKYNIPTPKLCPDCRQQRRLSFRNERKLFKRKCDATGKDIISLYSPDKKYKVYNQDYWWSDKWNAMDYGRDFDFNKTFFEQFEVLIIAVPKISIYTDQSMENSDYANYGQNCRNLYLCVNCYNLSDSYYSTSCFAFFNQSETNNIDSMDCTDSSYIYESINLKKCSNCFYSINLEDSYECIFSEDLKGCSNCICSFNKINKKFLFLNNPISEEEFYSIKNKMFLDVKFRNESIKKYNLLKNALPYKSSHNYQSENISGDFIINSKNVHESFLVGTVENGKYLFTSGYNSKNLYDGMNSGGNSEYTYETLHTHNDYKCSFLIDVDGTKNSFYCYQCYSCSNLFGCVGFRNKEYCILNKQYTKEEYEILVPKIIEHMKKTGEWGEFFPSNISPFGYNESVANEYYPLNPPIPNSFPPRENGNSTFFSFSPGGKDAGKADRGIFNRSNYEHPFSKVEKTIPANKLPNNINNIPDDILNWAIECEVTNKPFKIIKSELEFYRKHNLPIPKRHPDQRHLDRMNMRNPRKLFDRKCDKCGIDMITTYAPERKEIVYCEECYNKAVY